MIKGEHSAIISTLINLQLDPCFVYFRVAALDRFQCIGICYNVTLFILDTCKQVHGALENSEDPNELLHYVAVHKGLHLSICKDKRTFSGT